MREDGLGHQTWIFLAWNLVRTHDGTNDHKVLVRDHLGEFAVARVCGRPRLGDRIVGGAAQAQLGLMRPLGSGARARALCL